MENNDLFPLPDDELDDVTGGTNAKNVKALAEADGRTVAVASGNFFVGLCICAAHNKWARSSFKNSYALYYTDIKCYKCGTTWSGLEIRIFD